MSGFRAFLGAFPFMVGLAFLFIGRALVWLGIFVCCGRRFAREFWRDSRFKWLF